MTNYRPHSSLMLILTLLSACSSIDNRLVNSNEDNPPNLGGSGGSTVLPSPEIGGNSGTGGSDTSVAGAAGAGNGGEGGTTSLPIGEAGNGGEGGNVSYPDAGSAGAVSGGATGNEGGTGGTTNDPDAGQVRVCNTPQAVPSDKSNWFTTNGRANEFFQLITFDGFSKDRCTYTGQIRWFYEGADGYWESNRQYDQPLTTFVFQFELDGTMVVDVIAPTEAYPNGSLSFYPNFDYVGSCFTGISGGRDYTNAEYIFYWCIAYYYGGHTFALHVFAARWNDNLSRPVEWQFMPPRNAG